MPTRLGMEPELRGPWVVTTLFDRGGRLVEALHPDRPMRVSLAPAPSPPFLAPRWRPGAGSLTGHDGCNEFGVTYVRRGPTFRVILRTMSTTLALCEGTPPLQDRLLDVRRLTLDARAMTWRDADGRVVARLGRPEPGRGDLPASSS